MNCSVIFYPNLVVLQDLSNGKVLGAGKEESNLYFIRTPCKYVVSTIIPHVVGNFMLWHTRFDHVSLKILEHVNSFNLSKNKTLDVADCPIWLRAKLIRNSFTISYSRVDVIFKLVNADVWGPYHSPTTKNKHIFFPDIGE